MNFTFKAHEICRDIGIRTAQNESYYTKRAQTINIFWGLQGLLSFVLGYKMGKALKEGAK